MQHLQEAYEGVAIDTVKYCDQLGRCLCSLSVAESHGFEYADFVGFPAQHGFLVDREYVLQPDLSRLPIPCNLPNNDGPRTAAAAAAGAQQAGLRALTKDEFLQSWLFFGLIRCVVRADEPILKVDLTRKGGPRDGGADLMSTDQRRLDTRALPDALRRWHDYLRRLHAEHPDAAEMRCVQAIQMLTLAKRVVIANLAEDRPRLSLSGTAGAGGSHANHHPLLQKVRSFPDGTAEQDLHALSLMILGETLSASLIHNMRACGISIRDWQVDEGGWGPPAYVSKMMAQERWCVRFQEVLKGQLGRNATLLYMTLKRVVANGNRGAAHELLGPDKKCTVKKCYHVEAYINPRPPGETKDVYRTLHYPPGSDDDHVLDVNCWMKGPNAQEILDIITESQGRKGVFPLLRIVNRHGRMLVKVETWAEGKEFATISHVWAHGLGNSKAQKIWSCQLDLIRDLLDQTFGRRSDATGLGDHPSHLFWLDTLAIPIIPPGGDRSLRRRAIDLIYHVYDQATHCVVVDRNLLLHGDEEDSRTVAIRLLSSGWMRRLWTLQEAFMSRHLSIAFRDAQIRNFETLWTDTREVGVMRVALTEMIERKLSQNLMGQERRTRNAATHGSADRQDTRAGGAMLIASAWRSTRFRDMGRLEQETLALASLLNLPVGDEAQYNPSDRHLPDHHPERVRRRMELMRDFWIEVERDPYLHGAIPPGIIFLPGERLALPGFGWAPLTWLSGRDEDYPFPLDDVAHGTEVAPSGLMVRYPGYLIRSTLQKRFEIIGVNSRGLSFEFSVSSGLYDWYRAEPVDEAEGPNSATVQNIVAASSSGSGSAAGGPRLAIILSRPRPVEFPGEIALLVEIYNEESAGGVATKDGVLGSADEEPTYYCRIIRRMVISRLSLHPAAGAGESSAVTAAAANGASVLGMFARFDGQIIGEAVPVRQRWCVDAYHPPAELDAPPSPRPDAPESRSGAPPTTTPPALPGRTTYRQSSSASARGLLSAAGGPITALIPREASPGAGGGRRRRPRRLESELSTRGSDGLGLGLGLDGAADVPAAEPERTQRAQLVGLSSMATAVVHIRRLAQQRNR